MDETRKVVKLVRATGTRRLTEYVENLPVPLTDEERLARGTSLVRLRDEERNIEAEFETQKQSHKKAMGEIASMREQLEQAIREKREPRPTRVEGWAHFDQATYREIRVDTGEIISERPLLAVECQEELPLGKG